MNSKNPALITDRVACIILVLLSAGCFLPVVGKAFHIDEPLFLWTAGHILENPLDFYGFKVNWEGTVQPMASVTQNPPLAAYYLALLVKLFGWHESMLHLGFLVMGFLAVWGTYRLSRDMSCTAMQSLFAALATFCTPAFMVSANSVMCDMMMLALWVWSIIWWRRGLKTDNFLLFLLTGLIVTACALTKYFGMALIPLLFCHALVERKRPGLWLVALLLPVLGLGIFQYLTSELYGHGLLSNAVAYAAGLRVGGGVVPKSFTGLAFTGGCLVSCLCAIPLVFGKRGVICFLVSSVLLGAVLNMIGGTLPPQVSLGYLAQMAVMAAAGCGVLLLALLDYRQHRDADGLLLFCWVAGTFIFTVYCNWTISARNILPMAPAVGLMLARRICRHEGTSGRSVPNSLLVGSLMPALVLALMVAWADYTHAQSARNAAETIRKATAGLPGNIWFQGHWGFQYYAQLLGMRPFDQETGMVGKGDVMIVPVNNSYIVKPDNYPVVLKEKYLFGTFPWLSTMNAASGAGFYSDGWGSLPFVAGPAPKEVYYAFIAR